MEELQTEAHTQQLFASLISEIKSYSGKDPLLPWLRGICKIKESLPPPMLNQKLPRFLQKCAQTFQHDQRYRNDSRYLRVWIQLMDFVDNPGELLRTMEKKKIGAKWALYYQAYALYYEKLKKFADSERMYHLGVQNLAEPVDALQKSYEQFLHRMEIYEQRKARKQEQRAAKVSSGGIPSCRDGINLVGYDGIGTSSQTSNKGKIVKGGEVYPIPNSSENKKQIGGENYSVSSSCDMSKSRLGEGSKSRLGEGSIEKGPTRGGSDGSFCCTLSNAEHHDKDVIKKIEDGSHLVEEDACKSFTRPVDMTSKKDAMGNLSNNDPFEQRKNISDMDADKQIVFCSDDTIVVSQFVDFAIVGQSEAEDACHHGLVDPTVNMKEAMDDINSMFREPLEVFQHKDRRKAQRSLRANMEACNGFEVFVDESLDEGKVRIGGDLVIDPIITDESNVAKGGFHHHGMKKQSKEATFKIFIDDDDDDNGNEADKITHCKDQRDDLKNSVIPTRPEEDIRILHDDDDDGPNRDQLLPHMGLNEDSVVRRFMGSTIFEESEVEDACHHGLVDPTVNLKEAIQDINSMFGKPLDFVTNRTKKQLGRLEVERKQERNGFSILADDSNEHSQGRGTSSSSLSLGLGPAASTKFGSECDLFEPTLFTKEAMAEINDMFGRPLDYF